VDQGEDVVIADGDMAAPGGLWEPGGGMVPGGENYGEQGAAL
jgi:hypothetical protein